MPQFPHRKEQTLLCPYLVLPAWLERSVGFSPRFAAHARQMSRDLSLCEAVRQAPSPVLVTYVAMCLT